MTNTPESARIYTFLIADENSDDYEAKFIIDDRTYNDPENGRADRESAIDTLEQEGKRIEFTTDFVEPQTPAPDLPSWHDYRKTL